MGAFIKTLLTRVYGTSHTSPCCCVIPPDPGDLPAQSAEAALFNAFGAFPHLHDTGCKVEPLLLAYRCI